jgi:putative redox protein
MKCELIWKTNFEFVTSIRSHQFPQDATTVSGGTDHGPTPKELVLAAICGCTGMDVVGLMKKTKTQLQSFRVTADAELTKQHPKVFTSVVLKFEATGEPQQLEPYVDAIRRSQTLYCGVSAMIAQVCPIVYTVWFNGSQISEGRAEFPDPQG